MRRATSRLSRDADRKWPPKPRPNTRCDATFGTGRTPVVHAPVVMRCTEKAVETVKTLLGIEMWLCASCVESLAARDLVLRNPRKFPKQVS